MKSINTTSSIVGFASRSVLSSSKGVCLVPRSVSENRRARPAFDRVGVPTRISVCPNHGRRGRRQWIPLRRLTGTDDPTRSSVSEQKLRRIFRSETGVRISRRRESCGLDAERRNGPKLRSHASLHLPRSLEYDNTPHEDRMNTLDLSSSP